MTCDSCQHGPSRKHLGSDFPQEVRAPGTLPSTPQPTRGRNGAPGTTELCRKRMRELGEKLSFVIAARRVRPSSGNENNRLRRHTARPVPGSRDDGPPWGAVQPRDSGTPIPALPLANGPARRGFFPLEKQGRQVSPQHLRASCSEHMPGPWGCCKDLGGHSTGRTYGVPVWGEDAQCPRQTARAQRVARLGAGHCRCSRTR